MNTCRSFFSRHSLSALACLISFAPWGIAGEAPNTSAEVFQMAKVWDVRLTFTAEQWKAIEPTQGQGPGGNHGLGDFDPSSRMAAAFLKEGDSNQDKSLGLEEWTELGKKWFQVWSDGKDVISMDNLSEAVGKSLMGEGPGPGGGNGMGGIPKGMDFPVVHASLDFNGASYADVAIRYKGNNTYMRSRDSLKRSFKIDLNKYVKGQKLGELTTINLHSNVADPSWMSEPLSYRVYRDAGVPAPRTSYARVYVTVPGLYSQKYFGLYSVVENIDNAFLKDRFQSKKGALFKPSLPDLFHYAGEEWSKYESAYDPKDEVSVDQAKRVMEFSKLVTEGTDVDFAAKAGGYLDLEKFAQYMAVTVWLSTLDSILALGHNYYVYLNPESNKFELLPWDMDQSFGQFEMGGSDQSSLNIFKPWQGQKRFLERVYALPEFQTAYRKDLQKLSAELFTAPHVAALVDEITPVIRSAVSAESDEKLKSFDALASGKAIPFGQNSMRPVGTQLPPERKDGVDAARPPGDRSGQERNRSSIKSYTVARDESVLSQLDGKLSQDTAGEGRTSGGPGGFPGGGPGRMLEQVFAGFDSNKDGKVTLIEFNAGFAAWFILWDTDKNGKLSKEEIQAALKALIPMRPQGPPGGHP